MFDISSQMSNLFPAFMQSVEYLIEHLRHSISSVEHFPSFLVSVHEHFYVSLQIFVKLLHLNDAQNTSIYFSVQPIMLSNDCPILFGESLQIQSAFVKISLCPSQNFFLVFQSICQLFIFVNSVVEIRSYLIEVRF